MRYFFFLLMPLAMSAQQIIPLHDNWSFYQEGEEVHYKATVPGVVQLDLMENGLIPDPFLGTNEDSIQWVERENWLYEKEFDLPRLDTQKVYDLVFEGLDTYAEVYLNDSLILKADNMFCQWRVDVRPFLQKQKNKLCILFRSPIAVNKDKLDGRPYHKTAENEAAKPHVSVYTRKAPHHFGWDWGPRIVTAGIWRPVYLHIWQKAEIEDFQIYQQELHTDSALLMGKAAIRYSHDERFRLRLLDKKSGQILAETDSTVLSWIIKDPQRWWPHNLGQPHLYQWTLQLLDGQTVLDEYTRSFGLREIELINEPDDIGESFYFKVNGEPVFMKGANYIPSDAMLPRRTRADIDRLLEDARAANMNMIRVWGGGVYEEDYFYEKCDELGLMVWQDFMFACSMYPANEPFLSNIKKEIIYNVKRLRNHPSIAIWCGNNEVDVAWHNWGWQLKYFISKKDSAKMWEDYVRIFHKTIPNILAQYDPERPYTSTSPLSNWGKLSNFNYATMHFWGVWHGRQPFSDYNIYVGRFMSEYGFQSFPDWKTIEHFATPDQYSLSSTVMKKHQKSYIGNGMIASHTRSEFKKPKGFQEFVYKSQLTQMIGIRTAIRAHRARKGHCMGTLFWQLNDCWPGPSWSSIDYYGRWKALHYALPELYANIAILPEQDFNNMYIKIVSDELKEKMAELRVQAKTFNGQLINTVTEPISINANQTREYLRFNTKDFIKKHNKKKVYLDLQVITEDSVLAHTLYYLKSIRSLKLKQPQLNLELDKKQKRLRISSNTLIKNLYLYSADTDVHFYQNYLDIQADQQYEIFYEGALTKNGLRWLYVN